MSNGVFANRKDKRYIYACLAGVIVMFMYLALLIVSDITPFGDNTWVMYDLKRQYIDFYSYYRQIFRGSGSALYSFNTALGSGMIGFFIYYLNNPLFLIFNLFTEEELPNAVSLVIGLTLVIGSVIMALFLSWYTDPRRRNRSKSTTPGEAGSNDGLTLRPAAVIMCSVAWAFCGFLIAHGMNMMWTDVVIMLPLIIYATEGMISKDGPSVRERVIYVISLACILLFNYYISYQVLLYVAVWTLVSLWVRREKHPVRKVIDLAVCTVIPVLLDAVVLLPTLLELADSPKDITKLGMEATGRMLSPIDVFSKLFIFAYDDVQPRFGLPQVYAGVIILIPALLFFADRSRTFRERIGRLMLLSVLLLSFCIDQFNLFWHAMMEPSGHPYRQAPLFVFTVLLCAADHISGICTEGREEDGRQENGNTKEIILRHVCVFVILELILTVVTLKGYEYTGRKMYAANQILIIIGSVGSCLTGTVGRRSLSKMIIMVLSGILAFELLANAVFTYPYISMNGEKMSSYRIKVRETEETVTRIKAMDSGAYRMENLTPRQQNDGLMYGYNGVTHYSSAGMTYVRYLLQKLGYNDDALYTHYGHDNTVTMDMLLGIKYIMTEEDGYVHRAYEPVTGLTNGKVHAFRNPYALPLAVAVTDYDLNGITDIEDPGKIDMDPFSLQEDMVSRLAGHKEKLFEPIKPELDISDTSMEALLVTEEAGEVYMYLDGIMDKIQGLAVYADDEFLTGYGNLGCYKILNLGYHDAGDEICIKVDSDSEGADFGDPIFVTEDINAVEEAYEEIAAGCPKVTLPTSSSIEISGIPDNSGIFTSIPYEKGWSIEGQKVYGALMYIPQEKVQATADEGALVLRFVPAGMKAGGAVSIVALVFCIICMVLMREKAKTVGKRRD